MNIRLATLCDHAGVSDVLTASYPTLMPSGYDPAVLQAVLPLMTEANPRLLDSGTYFVAVERDALVVGCGGWTRERPGTGELEDGLGHIRHFATHPEFTGKGVGRALYLACETQARAMGISQFECYSSLNAEGFYRSVGFEPLERIDVPMGNDRLFPSVRMLLTFRS